MATPRPINDAAAFTRNTTEKYHAKSYARGESGTEWGNYGVVLYIDYILASTPVTRLQIRRRLGGKMIDPLSILYGIYRT